MLPVAALARTTLISIVSLDVAIYVLECGGDGWCSGPLFSFMGV